MRFQLEAAMETPQAASWMSPAGAGCELPAGRTCLQITADFTVTRNSAAERYSKQLELPAGRSLRVVSVVTVNPTVDFSEVVGKTAASGCQEWLSRCVPC